jgi:hypothetical protein
MAGHNAFTNLGMGLAVGDGHLPRIASGETLRLLNGVHMSTARGFGAGTFYPPNVEERQIGLRIHIVADGNQVWKDKANNTIVTLTDGDCVTLVAKATNAWAIDGAVQVAADLAISDFGSFFTATSTEGALQEVGAAATRINLMPSIQYKLAAGAPVALAVFADNASPNPGYAVVDAEAQGVRWNNNATQDQPVAFRFTTPNIGDELLATLRVRASKTGATVGDATTFTVTLFVMSVGLLHDASSNTGGTTTAMTGNATAKTIQEVTLALLGSTLLPNTTYVGSITPTSGTLGTDDVTMIDLFVQLAPTYA